VTNGVKLTESSFNNGSLVQTWTSINQWVNITLILDQNQFITSVVINNRVDAAKSDILAFNLGVFKNGDMIAKDKITSDAAFITVIPTMLPIAVVKQLIFLDIKI
jgi:hypothetical protein